jgi:pimeloyl-ACP methyl ester carboxylesterase
VCLLALGLCAGVAAGSAASARTTECGRGGVVCSTVSVPLDWSGKQAGHVSLAVEVQRPKGASRGVIFLLAGGPGQASTHYFDIAADGYWAELFRGYTLVSFDPRGTGDSDRLRCHIPSQSPPPSRAAAIVAACANELGPRRDFFATSDNVRDIDAIRRKLGFTRIGLYGASYGTDLALAYARTFPARVQRLVLD